MTEDGTIKAHGKIVTLVLFNDEVFNAREVPIMFGDSGTASRVISAAKLSLIEMLELLSRSAKAEYSQAIFEIRNQAGGAANDQDGENE